MLDILDDDDEAGTAAALAADNDAPPGPDGPTHVTRELECALTDAEVQERGEAMAQDEREIDRLKTRRKSLNAQIRAKYDHMTEMAQAIDTRREVRDVACTWRPDYVKKAWELQRDDTRAVLATRQMTAIDLQTRLPLDSVAVADAADVEPEGTAGELDGDDAHYANVDDPEGYDFDADPEAGAVVLPPEGDDGDDGDPVDVPNINPAPVAGTGYRAASAALLPARSTPAARAVLTGTSAKPNGTRYRPPAAPVKPIKRGPKVRTRSNASASNGARKGR